MDVESNKSLHYIIYFYVSNSFEWREELLASATNGKG